MTIPHHANRLHLAGTALAMLVLHSCSPEPACAATPLQLRWTAELSDPKPYNAVLFAGESADLVATLKLYGRAVALEDTATAALYYQTNGMGSAWWQSPATVTTAGVVTASWTPDMDAGADFYRWHIGVANAASSTIYRAFGAFRMQPSPGAAPNALAPPVRWIDFDAITISNAPWATPADVAEATEGMLTTEADPVALPVAEAALGFATNALPKTGGTLSGLITASAFQTLPDPELGLTSLFTPLFITLGYDSALGPLGSGVLNVRQNRIEGVNSYGQLWNLYYPTNHPTATFATLDDIPDVSDLATKSEVDVISNLVETTRGTYVDIATNVVYHVVVSNGHWLIREGN